MPGHKRKSEKKQQQKSLPSCEWTDEIKARRIMINIQTKDGKCLTEEKDILNQWTEYWSELHSLQATGDPTVLNVPQPTDNDNHPILRVEVEAAITSLKKGKSTGIANIATELVQAGDEGMTMMLLKICNKIWQIEERDISWTQSLIMIIYKKSNP